MRRKKNHFQFRLPLFLALCLIAVLIPAVYFKLIRPRFAQAGWFDTNWGYRQKVPISNTSTSQSDYQLLVTLDSATLVTAGKLQSDCDDVRLTDYGGKPLSFWIEPTTCNTTTTKIWVKVPSIPASASGVTANIFLYYGNPSAASGQASTSTVFIRDMDAATVAWPLNETSGQAASAVHPAVATGRDIVINGTFTSDTSWAKGSGWSISGDAAQASGTTTLIYQQPSEIIIGKSYQVTFTISNYSSGTATPYIRGAYGTARSANGTYTETIVAGSTNGIVGINGAGGGGFTGTVDNLLIKQLNIPASTSIASTELLTDGDMEAAGVAAWTVGNSATLTKDTTAPLHGGAQHLRVARNTTDYPYARQSILTSGKKYRITGYARSDGNALPYIYIGSNNIVWTGTSSTSWQAFDVIGNATSANFDLTSITTTGTQYADWDDISVTEVSPMTGSISGATLNSASGDTRFPPAYSFDGSNDYVNIYSSDLNSAFNPSEGTLVAWVKVSGSGVWSDGAYREVIRIGEGGNNAIQLVKNSTSNNFYASYIAGGTLKNVFNTSFSSTNWFQAVVTWSKTSDELKLYMNGAQVGSTTTGLGNWSGNLTSTSSVIGSENSSGLNPWSGLIGDTRLYPRALSATEISDLYGTATSGRNAYYTGNYAGHDLIRKYDTGVSLGALAAEETSLGPVAYWSFDEGTGQTPQDASSSNIDGILGATTGTSTDDPAWTTEDQCVSGKCLKFDGGDYVTTSNISTKLGTSASFIAWIKTSSNANMSILGNYNASVAAGPLFETTSGKAAFHNGSTGTVTSTTTISDNRWHHVAVTITNNDAKIYVDGILESTQAFSLVKSSTSNYLIGAAYSSSSPSYYFTGFIDSVKIFPYVISSTQIAQEYQTGFATLIGTTSAKNPLSNGLISYWKLDEATGSAVLDSSGNGYTGTLVSAQETGIAQAASTTTTVVDTTSSLSATNDAYTGMVLTLTGGTGCSVTANTDRAITDYDGTTKTFTLSVALSAEPDSCGFIIKHQTAGKFGNGLQFDSRASYSNQGYVTVADNSAFDGNNQLTVSVWMYDDNSTAQDDYFAKGGEPSGTATVWALYRSSTGSKVRLANASGTLVELNAVHPFNQWNHITATYDGQKVRFYINGELKNSQSLTGATQSNSSLITLGGHGSGNDGFNGRLDEARVYNRALSDKEVRDLYNWAPGPVAQYTFDDKSSISTSPDTSGWGNTLTMSGSMTSDDYVPGKFGSALDFDGTNDQFTAADSTSLSTQHAVTIEGWFKMNASPGDPGKSTFFGMAQKDGGYSGAPNYGLRLLNATRNLYAYLAYDAGSGQSGGIAGPALGLNQWYHLAMTYDRTVPAIKLFVNGVHTSTATNFNHVLRDSPDVLRVAAGDNRFFSGSIDDVRVYNYARSNQQIVQDMNAGHPAGGSPVGSQMAYYKLDDGSGTSSQDSVADYDLTLTATEWKTQSNCKFGSCLYYSGADLAQANVDFNNGDYTLTAFIYPTATSSFSQIVGADNGNNTNDGLILNNNNVCFHEYGTGSTDHNLCSTTNPVQLNTWSHVALTMSGSTVTVYHNGTQVATETYDTTNSSTKLNVGGNTSLLEARTFDGYIDEVKVYSSALTADQILTDYNQGVSTSYGGSNEASGLPDGAGNPPVAEWKFDENTGITANDTSGNGSAGTLTGTNGLPTWTIGKTGSALNFDGVDDYVSVGNPAPLQISTGTVQAWVKTTNPGSSYRVIIQKQNGYGIFLKDNEFGLYDWGASAFRGTGTNLNDGQWHYVAASFQSGVADGTKLYIDGLLKLTTTMTVSSPASITIGAQGGTTQQINGLVDSVKIYDYVRTPAQIAYDYNRGAPIAHWKFDECEGDSANDSSGNSRTGTITIGAGGTQTTAGTCSTSGAWNGGATGKYSSSLNFDGTDDYIAVPSGSNITLGNDMTVSSWIKTTTAFQRPIFSNRSGSPGLLYYGMTGGKFFIYYNSSTPASVTSNTSINDNTWHHLVYVRTGTTTNLYIDGVLDKSTTQTGYSATADAIRIGSDQDNNEFFPGQIDDLRVYNYALSASQVLKLKNEGFSQRFGP